MLYDRASTAFAVRIMSRARLYIPIPLSAGTAVELKPEQAHYLGRVLRLRTGSELTVFDGSGVEFPARVALFAKNLARLEIGAALSRDVESPLHLRLVQGISRGERMDFVVQKATELGVTEIQPVLTEHTVVKLGKDRAARRIGHWQRVAASACEQCGRNTLPRIADPLTLDAYLAQATDADARLMLALDAGQGISEVASAGGRRFELLVGPEGGLSEPETGAAASAGFRACSLGPRVLRSETAGITAVAIMQSLFGDLGRQS